MREVEQEEEEVLKSSDEEEKEERQGRLDIANRSGRHDDEEEELGLEENRQHLGPVGRSRKSASKVDESEQEDGDEDEEEEEDAEANQDLSLLIVEKAKKRRKVEGSRAPGEDSGLLEDRLGRGSDEGVASAADERNSRGSCLAEEETEGQGPSRSASPEEGELKEDGEGNLVLASDIHKVDEIPDGGGKKKKKKKKEKKEKEKKKKKKGGDSEGGKPNGRELQLVGAEESIVMRKLLRGPRYFDPPEEQDQTCSTCGQVGHLAVNCNEVPRQKPCYVCGAFGHDGRDCPQKTDCYVCGKVGHIAKNCPNKGLRTPTARGDELVCLLCGRTGHEAPTCYYDYDKHDLEQVQCYICKEFGHLSCVDIVDTTPVPVSCYMCGEMGHTGQECFRPWRLDRDKDRDRDRSHASRDGACFKCGEEGHFARDCSKLDRNELRSEAWSPPWRRGETYTGGEYATPGSKKQRRSGGGSRWMDLSSREDRWTPSARHHPLNPLGDHKNVNSASKGKGISDDDRDYMGPVENFVDNSKENFRSRRKKSWGGDGGRKRSYT